eukprot:3966836-Amphidinium_carterae.1
MWSVINNAHDYTQVDEGKATVVGSLVLFKWTIHVPFLEENCNECHCHKTYSNSRDCSHLLPRFADL